MITILSILSIGFLVLTFVWLWRISYSYRELKRARKKTSTPQLKTPIHIILPVLNEDIRLSDFAHYFTEELLSEYSHTELWIVTTEREKTDYPNARTIQLAKKLANSHASIHHLHYPHTKGVMAHQLNYAIRHMPDSGLFAIYNADSRPEPKTFSWVAEHYDSKRPSLFQQYGIYTKNISYIEKQRTHSSLIANMYWQCRWTIGFEFYRAVSAVRRKQWPPYLRAFNYCIGHGLFASATLIKQLQFSETTTNEDAILGLEASAQNITIQPIPYFDLAESPDSLSSIYMQKTNWFQGPFQAPLYYQILRKKYPNANKLLLLLNCAKLFSHAVYWIIGPLSLVTCIILALIATVTSSPLFILCAYIPLLFLVLPPTVVHIVLTKLHIRGYLPGKDTLSTSRLFNIFLLGYIPSYVIHGAAGIRGLLLSRKILNGTKLKTKMAQYGES